MASSKKNTSLGFSWSPTSGKVLYSSLMSYVYPIWPCPEGKKARKEIAEIILQ